MKSKLMYAILIPALVITAAASDLSLVDDGARIWVSDSSELEIHYYSLSDNSLQLVKFTWNGEEHTLPRSVSADGIRYTMDMELVWWETGNTAVLQTRNVQGEWETAKTFSLEE